MTAQRNVLPKVTRVNGKIISEHGDSFQFINDYHMSEVIQKSGRKIRFKTSLCAAFEGTEQEVLCGIIHIFPEQRWYDGTLATPEELDYLIQFLAAALFEEELFPDIYIGTHEQAKQFNWDFYSVCAEGIGGNNVSK